MGLGYHPYRYGVQGLAHWRQSLDPAYARTLDRIAEALDPERILGQKICRPHPPEKSAGLEERG
jgi:hypothetical protein